MSQHFVGKILSVGKRPLSLGVAIVALLICSPAWSLPSFAQQTGVGCAQCHTIAFGPALSAFGRDFKAYGYTSSTQSSVPLSGMAIGSFTRTAQDQPGGAAPHYGDNSNGALDELNAFYAGRISQHVGAFVQVTYSGVERHLAWDNLDIRYARQTRIGGGDLLFGVSLNNSPTVQDLWSSLPTWSFPETGSSLAPTPAAATQLEDTWGQQVLGLSVYTQWNRWLYLELGGYRSLSPRLQSDLGVQDTEDADRLRGVAPYWRATLQHQVGAHYGSIGIFGFAPRVRPGGSTNVNSDKYTDLGYDATYQFASASPYTVNANARFIHERRNLRASTALGDAERQSNHLNAIHLDVQAAYRQTYAASIGFFDTSGGRDSVAYAAEEISGSATGSPNSRGYTAEVDWIPWGKLSSPAQPWLNLRLGLQYTAYSRFNGASSNYDGFGRAAHDNDTLYAFAWTAF